MFQLQIILTFFDDDLILIHARVNALNSIYKFDK